MHKLPGYTLLALVFLSPLLFATFTPNFFSSPKALLTIVALTILVVSTLYKILIRKELVITKSRLLLPLALFTLNLILNIAFHQEARTEAVMGYATLYIGATIISLYANSLSSHFKQIERYFVYAISGSSLLLAIYGLLNLTIGTSLTFLPTFMTARSFTPSGSPLTTLTILIIGMVATYSYAAIKLRGMTQYFMLISGIIQTIAAAAYASLMLPGGELAPSLLPYTASWSIALDSLKNIKSFFFGVGLANFSTLYTSVKPLSLNSTSLWATIPNTATSEILQIIATQGFIGLLAFLFIPFSVLFTKQLRLKKRSTTLFVFITSLIVLFLSPVSLPTILIFMVSGALIVDTQEQEYRLSKPLSYVITAITVAMLGTYLYYYTNYMTAEYHVRKAQIGLSTNNGLEVYNHSIRATQLLPSMTSYHLSYSQVNLSLASALSQNGNLTDDQRKQIAALVSQAIREGKIASNLRPSDARNWANLGNIYRQLVNVADGSDQYSIAAYAQAVRLDPGNPSLRTDLGTLLYQLSSKTEDPKEKEAYLTRAVQELQTAIVLKSDFAYAHYNLSRALSQAGNYQAAYDSMTRAIASLDPNSQELEKATEELDALKTKIPTSKEVKSPSLSGSSELSEPSPFPSPLPGGPLQLDTESQ